MPDNDLKKYIDTLLRLEARTKDRPLSQTEAEQIALDTGIAPTVITQARTEGHRLLAEGWAFLNDGNAQQAELPLRQAVELLPWEGRCWLGLARIQADLHHKTGLAGPWKLSRTYAERALALPLDEADRQTADGLRLAKAQTKASPVVPVLIGLAVLTVATLAVLNLLPAPVETVPAPVASPTTQVTDLPVNLAADWPADLNLTARAQLTRFADSWSCKISLKATSGTQAWRRLDLEAQLLNPAGQILQVRKFELLYANQPPILPGEALTAGNLFFQKNPTKDTVPSQLLVRVVASDGFASGPEQPGALPATVETASPLPQVVAVAVHWREAAPGSQLKDRFFYSGLIVVKNSGTRPLTKLKLGVTYRDAATSRLYTRDLWVATADQPAFLPNEVRPVYFIQDFPLNFLSDFQAGRNPLTLKLQELN